MIITTLLLPLGHILISCPDDRRTDGYRPNDRRTDGYHCRDDGGQGRARRDHSPTPYVNTTCQICKIHGHSASDCWWHRSDDKYDVNYNEKGANLASYGVDTNCYTDTGAIDHVTSELNKLLIANKYYGQDQVRTAEGTGMHISHIGHLVLRTPHGSFDLKNILHVPSASKNLLSVHKFTLDNHVFIEFHPFFFLIKDQATRRILFRGPCYGGLYPLAPTFNEITKQAFLSIKPSSSTWHRRLGHSSLFIVQQVLRKNKIAYTPESTPYVCDSCQLA
jgi:hypothetical protein